MLKRPAASLSVVTKRPKQMGVLHGDVLARILSCLPWTEVMNCRLVSREWRDAALITPVQELVVDEEDIALALPSLAAAFPCLQYLEFVGGRLPNLDVNDELFVLTLLRGFHQLTSLVMIKANLQASAPCIMQFHSLEALDVGGNCALVWNLADLSALPRLKTLSCAANYKLTGDLSSLQVLSQTLTILDLYYCPEVTGDLHALAFFPCLERLKVFGTNVSGDVRKIESTDFPCLKEIQLGNHVYGGRTINHIEDAPKVMEAWYRFRTRNPGNFERNHHHLLLAYEAPERLMYQETPDSLVAPLSLEMVRIGPRCGWRWIGFKLTSGNHEGCEINWFNTEPRPGDNGHDEYVRDLAVKIGSNRLYRGLFVPPSPEEHRRMCSKWKS
jgi:hypothetical protein